MLMTLFRWIAYLTWNVWNGFQEFWIRVRKHQFEKTFLVFLASKVIRLSFSCELSLQISNCGISSLGSIGGYCCESCRPLLHRCPHVTPVTFLAIVLKRHLVIFLALSCRSSFEVFLIIPSCDLLRPSGILCSLGVRLIWFFCFVFADVPLVLVHKGQENQREQCSSDYFSFFWLGTYVSSSC